MDQEVAAVIAKFETRLREEQAAIARTKHMINELLTMHGEPPRYQDIDESEDAMAAGVLKDQFYGQPLATCVREILRGRKLQRLGPASVGEIFEMLKRGNFIFGTKDEENAKRGLRISLAKNAQVFHKLPDGSWGLLEWYPDLKSGKKVRDRDANGGDSDAGDDIGDDAARDEQVEG